MRGVVADDDEDGVDVAEERDDLEDAEDEGGVSTDGKCALHRSIACCMCPCWTKRIISSQPASAMPRASYKDD